MQSLTKGEVAAALDTATGDVKEALELRGEFAKSSVRKDEAMLYAEGANGHGRGFLRFYGSDRTGRFADRLAKGQNLPRNHLPDLVEARGLAQISRSNDFEVQGRRIVEQHH